jgi:uncharacterized cofD-like protein
MKNIVVIGGGTGTFTVLSALKQYKELNLSAIVSMADDGGSTGRLRDELGVLPPGDVRQCLVALSESDVLMRDLFNYRFSSGALKGHNFGNLFISALEKITGGFDSAVESLEDILKIRGKVVPVTLDKIKLFAEFENGEMMVGEGQIDTSENLLSRKVKRFFLSPQGEVNPKAKEVINEADLIIIGPGDVYTSIIPNFLVNDLADFICSSKAKKVYLCNLMTKFGHSDNFSVADFAVEVEKYLGKNCLDYVVYNDKKPNEELIKKYARKKEYFVNFDKVDFKDKKYKSIGKDLIGEASHDQDKNDEVKRTLVRHNLEKLGKVILSIIKDK